MLSPLRLSPPVFACLITDRLLNMVILFPLPFAISLNWVWYPKSLHLLQSSILFQCLLIRKGSLGSSSISVTLTVISQKSNSRWKIGKFSSNTCRVTATCTNLIWNRVTTTLISLSPINSSWVFSGLWVVLKTDIFVSLFYLLGFRLLLTCLRSFSAR